MKYNSTLEYIAANRQRFADLFNAEKVLRQAAFDSKALVQSRVQQRGQLSNLALIGGGKYSGRVIKPAFGKARTFANKRQLKSITGKEGYAQLRQKVGRQIAYIDLTFSGDMCKAFIVSPGKGSYSVGFTNDQARIAGFNEKRFGRVFGLSDGEYNQVRSIIESKIKSILSGS